MTDSMTRPRLLVATHGAVRVLTLNRPAALNSFTAAMHAACCRRCDDGGRRRGRARAWCSPAPAAASAPGRT